LGTSNLPSKGGSSRRGHSAPGCNATIWHVQCAPAAVKAPMNAWRSQRTQSSALRQPGLAGTFQSPGRCEFARPRPARRRLRRRTPRDPRLLSAKVHDSSLSLRQRARQEVCRQGPRASPRRCGVPVNPHFTGFNPNSEVARRYGKRPLIWLATLATLPNGEG